MKDFKAGSIVNARNRDWIVLPCTDSGLLILKPLGGSDDEITAIYKPLNLSSDIVVSSEFPYPTSEDIGDLRTSKILYNASRLSFRNGAGPFRSIGKLSFRPRSYQMVPLIMALKQSNPIRMLIADDVGVGKTIEAMLIVKELLERGEIKRFAVICLPHLCEQWQQELRDKFGIEAVIIRSNTQAQLDREIDAVSDVSVYHYYPYQVISVDYIKSDSRRQIYIQECPELIIVDEAHTCTKPAGASRGQQQRYKLIFDIAKKPKQNLLLLTATPHSGKQEEFQSLLGLLKHEFETLDLLSVEQAKRKEIARYFVQRRRADVEKWMNEDTSFPERKSIEVPYELSDKYSTIYSELLDFAQELTKKTEQKQNQQRFNYWTALALLRGVMSSPEAGAEMLVNRIQKTEDIEVEDEEQNPLLDDDYGFEGDYSPSSIIGKTELSSTQNKKLHEIAVKLENLRNFKDDKKAALCYEVLVNWLNEGFNIVVFCKYIATAKYLGRVLEEGFKKKYKDLGIQVITSEEPDEVRKQRIEEMIKFKKRILIATDCISEGVNLQSLFTAVIHYDLPWNPNKIEQREGRVDRFGQNAKVVKTCLIYGKDNPIDGVVLDVIIRKIKQIRKDIFISIPFPEDSKSIMDAVLHTVLLSPKKRTDTGQVTLEFDESEVINDYKNRVTKEIEAAAKREKESRSIFAQNTINANEIEGDLKITDEFLGKPSDVEDFVIDSLTTFGVQIDKFKNGYKLYTGNLPGILKELLPLGNFVLISFVSPTPEGYLYLGRNHQFVEQLCNYLIANSLNHKIEYGPARAAVIKTHKVKIKTTLLLFRVRNVIEEKVSKKQIIAEEMIMIGYEGSVSDGLKILPENEVKEVLFNTSASSNLSLEARRDFFDHEIENIKLMQDKFNEIAFSRSEELVEAHERFRKLAGGHNYQAVKPVLPMDLMGVYILLPD